MDYTYALRQNLTHVMEYGPINGELQPFLDDPGRVDSKLLISRRDKIASPERPARPARGLPRAAAAEDRLGCRSHPVRASKSAEEGFRELAAIDTCTSMAILIDICSMMTP